VTLFSACQLHGTGEPDKQSHSLVNTRRYALAVDWQVQVILLLNVGSAKFVSYGLRIAARVAASQYFRTQGVPVIFTAVSADGDHGYVFVQETEGPCIACLFPDVADDDRYPCPGTPAIADILQAVGALTVYAVDTLLMKQRPRAWNYRRISLSGGALDGASVIPARQGCRMMAANLMSNDMNS